MIPIFNMIILFICYLLLITLIAWFFSGNSPKTKKVRVFESGNHVFGKAIHRFYFKNMDEVVFVVIILSINISVFPWVIAYNKNLNGLSLLIIGVAVFIEVLLGFFLITIKQKRK
ncbi:MAG: hypothetical protein A2381_08915 [Bdellovibrionales bacterium RIFOXYB1_FULL_37_110]|nr:MAG: hypothetical protein A2181_09110 [Bdellovibrionales bacterium RIFOXYA1_FULL_38_20]OFZ50349.1 MAG: hypothetical protein A2417_09015 [Bdellovibrionales bacterium RIFOXYC1_FULL_37_79]OFZ60958.1 MAG: hypothetical protein A2381_08915 [Bdellovibrionales bacterium RIFOXYB1_FULL_37_110]OFZ63702.1 MAG: hypothetical protein A2577_08035 [Bdellovibrionales bacterium RIFOXYD1_FULL_36_51]